MTQVMTQRGFTLIEVLVVLAVGSLVMASAVGIFFQTIVGTSRTNSQVIVLTDVHRAALQIKKDLSTYNTAELNDEQPDSITITWKDETFEPDQGTREYDATYSLSGTELLRIYAIDGNPAPAQIIGRHITYLSFTRNEANDRLIDVVITATEGGASPRSETLEFSIYQLKEEELPE